jgi:hypothetical protein
MESKFSIQNNKTKDILIVSFGGIAKKIGGILPFEFLNFLSKNMPEYDMQFYIDLHGKWYNKGLQGITSSIEETVEYLRNEIKDYKKVYFIGNSSGGYAAILFGSLLNVTAVISFVPQTIIYNQDADKKYKDIKPYINDTTEYYVYGDLSYKDQKNLHHISQVEHINKFRNVYAMKRPAINLQKMRDSGELFRIIKGVINGMPITI